MCSYFNLFYFLILVGLCAKVECRDPLNLALISNPEVSNRSLCAMVDHQSLSFLSPNPKEAKLYKLHPILRVDGCYAIPPPANVKGKMVVELSNFCAIQRQMENAMRAGATGLMLIIKNNVSQYPFKIDLTKAANSTFPVLVLTEGMYLNFTKMSLPKTDNIPIRIVGLPKPPMFSFGFIAFQTMALLCLIIGGYLSVNGLNGLKFAPIFGAPQQRYRISDIDSCSKELIFQIGSSTRYRHEESKLSPLQTTLCLLFFGVITVGVLLLLYFFYDIFVYVVIVFVGIVFVVSLKSQLMEVICRLPKLKDMDKQILITSKWAKMLVGPEIDVRSIVLFPFCIIPVVVYFVYRKDEDVVWIIQDILGIFACSYIIKIIRIGNLKLITIMCCAFFIYDIFMVYITPLFQLQGEPEKGYSRITDPLWQSASTRVKRSSGRSIMEDVATGQAGQSGERLPIMFIFPYMNLHLQPIRLACVSRQFSILGFGDIVVPGMLVAFAFMTDSRFSSVAGRCCRHIYALIVIAGYHFGLLLVFLLLLLMQTGQPALITLIPFTLIPFVVCAAIRGELRLLWSGTFPSMPVAVLEEEDNGNIGSMTETTNE